MCVLIHVSILTGFKLINLKLIIGCFYARILLEEKGVRDSFSNSLFHLKQIDLYGIAIHDSLVKLFCKHELEDDPALTVADTVPACLARHLVGSPKPPAKNREKD